MEEEMNLNRYPAALAIAAIMLATAACTQEETLISENTQYANSSIATDVPMTPEKQDQAFFIPGTAVVKFSEEMTAKIEKANAEGPIQLSAACRELGVTNMERVFPYAGEYEERTRREGMHRFYIVDFDPDIPLSKAQSVFEAVEGVELFEKQHKMNMLAYPNDPDFSRLWGLNDANSYHTSINVQKAWEYSVGKPEVIVGVVDEGIQLDHPDLAFNVSIKDHYNFVRNSSTIVAGEHGTHVAGTIAGVSNNGTGVAGIAGGNYAKEQHGVTLLSCEVFEGNNSARSFGSAVKWAADHGAVICQNSWGYNFDYNGDGELKGSELEAALSATIDSQLKSAVDYFIKYAGCDNSGNQREDSPMKGGLVVFAAGNDGIVNGAPANYAPIFSVGAIGQNGTIAYFSNYGSWVDICAPGVNIYSTIPRGEYKSLQGTSMACPHVSGAAALLTSYFGRQGFTAKDLEELLIQGANPNKVNYGSHTAGPYLDVYKSILYGIDKFKRESNQSPVINTEYKGNYTFHQWENVSIPFSITDPDGDVVKIEVEIEGRARFTRNSNDDSIYDFTLLCELVNDFTPKKVKIIATDDYDGRAEIEFSYQVLENRPPVCDGKIEDRLRKTDSPDETIDMSSVFSDPDEEPLKYKVITDRDGIVSASISDGKLLLRSEGLGLVTIKVTASDILGMKAETSFKVLVRDAGSEMEIYPNPVVDYLNIRTDIKPQDAEVKLTSASGSCVFDGKLSCSAFEPGRIDMRSCAPGKYSLTVKIDGKTTEKSIIKK